MGSENIFTYLIYELPNFSCTPFHQFSYFCSVEYEIWMVQKLHHSNHHCFHTTVEKKYIFKWFQRLFWKFSKCFLKRIYYNWDAISFEKPVLSFHLYTVSVWCRQKFRFRINYRYEGNDENSSVTFDYI